MNPQQFLIFTHVICCSRLPLQQAILSILSLHVLAQQFIDRHIFSSIKQTNWLINKGMRVLLFDVFKHLLLRKTDVLKTCPKSKFLGKKILRNALSLKSKKVQDIFRKTLFWHYYLQLSFVCKTVSQISFKLFCSVDKRLFHSSLGSEVDFRDIMNFSPNILAKN